MCCIIGVFESELPMGHPAAYGKWQVIVKGWVNMLYISYLKIVI